MISQVLKNILKIIIPKKILNYKNLLSQFFIYIKYRNLPTGDVFKTIYDNKVWTPENKKHKFDYYSGFGSHNKNLTNRYIINVGKFLKSFKKKPTIVELGCGDFLVSSNFISFSKKFIGLDIYKKLIQHNKIKYKRFKNVKFDTLDFTIKEPPPADICIVRCVLQHLSNKMILNFLKNINNKYKYLVITEHCPKLLKFKPNLDIISGPSIRLYKNSAVDLSFSPFNMKYKKKKILCKTYSKLIEGCLKTTLYIF